ncbi:MAG: TrmH family RNA methyltransferase [Rectinemataceae bacterium]
MIPIERLAKLSPRHRMRKAALVLGEIERSLLREGDDAESVGDYARRLGGLVAADSETEAAALRQARELVLAPSEGGALLRAVDALRHALLAATGQAPADWDLIDSRDGLPDRASRRVRPGLRVYVEDLRSPFNVGSLFRSADAFGIEEIILSPFAADPNHPRSQRSAMGALGLVPWRRAGLEALRGHDPVFALELGGSPLTDFPFPKRGIVVIGSEELGVSPEALALCSYGKVSIPMTGAKGSLNASVAFGILMYAWTSFLDAAIRV